ncbi:TonB-dependent receptor domain-containing protein [Sphingosinithalassobacter portus]|uniref:TonB-dependent receptor domain-containing protein n=1 Tax=Stakelama portus TaxID=2676234 RepID=UPI000D6DDE7A|nr:TonB-dependent receptor [Sphingosinithalassobacter portus]
MTRSVTSAPAKRRAGRLAASLVLSSAAAVLAVGIATPASAQVSSASLRGTISLDAGTTASEVTIIEVNTGFRRTATVSANGGYSFASLQPGRYRLEITTSNGVRSTDEFTLAVGQDAQLNFDFSTPELASSDEIVVTAGQIQTLEGGEVGATVSQRLIQTLPQNSRNFLAFADLAPGVTVSTGSNGNVSIQGGAQASRTSNVYIDGIGQKDYVLKGGLTGQDSSPGNPFPQLAIGEYRVISSNYKAEFDQVSSVAITAVTRSGTNEFHGEAFFDYTDQSLRSTTPSEDDRGGEKTRTKDMQFGVALGGPIIQDRMHFFVTYEGKRQQKPTEVEPGGGYTVAQFPNEYQGLFGGYSRDFNEDLFFGKIDFSPTVDDLIELSVKVRREEQQDGFGGQNAMTRMTNVENNETRGLLRWEHTGNGWINDLRISYEKSAWRPTPAAFENGYSFQTANGTLLLGTGASANYQDKGQKGWAIQNDFTYTGWSNHTIKAGVKAKWVTLNSVQRNSTNAQYTYNAQFPVGGGFNDQTPYRLTFGVPVAGVGDGTIKSKNFQLGIYVQDDWDVTDRLTLNIGLRWDYEETPAYLNFVHPQDAVDAVSPANYPNLNNANYNIADYISTGDSRHPFYGAFQPRIGFTYALDEDHRFELFGGYGRSYDRNQFDFLQQEITSGAFKQLTYNFNTGDPNHSCSGSNCIAWDPIYLTQAGRDQLATSTGGGGRELRFISNDLKIPYSDQFSLGIRGRLGSFRPEVGYSHIASRNGFAYLLGNRRPDGSFFAPGEQWNPPWGFAPSGFGNMLIGTNGISTDADSAYVKLTKDYTEASPWSVNFVYTFTLAEENRKFGEYFSLDYPSLDDYPVLRSAGVSKHSVVLAASADIPWGFTLATKIALRSPPYIYGIQGSSNADRVPVVTEGNNKNPFILGDLWAYRQVDLALSKTIPFHFIGDQAGLTFRVDVLNVFDTDNFVSYNGNANATTAPFFGDISGRSVGGNPPRTFKFSASMAF